jgi:hypothetical protein
MRHVLNLLWVVTMNGPILAEGQNESLMLPVAGDRLRTRGERAGVITGIWVEVDLTRPRVTLMTQPQTVLTIPVPTTFKSRAGPCDHL